ncbi:histidine phosphatase family protein [Agarivorans sp. DSG3-1]|uniref:histidine phosphatase family protein n=1 Tax=Agarivorans sp. DSG3-1 TaxID=3342249 RepID=UPI00398E3D89
MTRVLLIRHSAPLIAPNHCYGQLDVLAESTGLTLAVTKLSAQLAALSIDKVICSPLQRCSQLADALGLAKVVEYQTWLKEINFGLWEGQSWDTIPAAELQAWADNLSSFRLGKTGETVTEFRTRVLNEWLQLCALPEQEKTIVCICHAGVIRTIVGEVQNLAIEQSMTLPLNMGSLTSLKIHSQGVTLEYTNR